MVGRYQNWHTRAEMASYDSWYDPKEAFALIRLLTAVNFGNEENRTEIFAEIREFIHSPILETPVESDRRFEGYALLPTHGQWYANLIRIIAALSRGTRTSETSARASNHNDSGSGDVITDYGRGSGETIVDNSDAIRMYYHSVQALRLCLAPSVMDTNKFECEYKLNWSDY